LSIAAATPIKFIYSARKTSGSGSRSGTGLKINATVTREARTIDADAGVRFSSTDRAEDGGFQGFIGPRLTNYTTFNDGRSIRKITSSGANSGQFDMIAMTNDDLMPTVTVTDVIVRGINEFNTVTLGADELHVYSMATS